ncbi:cadmium-translocating P-type ATPase [Subdoligranulum sp. DSM 109015]|uniref:Cd(2+)-exporting ATPase n=1 Tax=Gemmiger gallinarum TaxID=2779354 RepID=A0ABR9R561_9FIRM|nr:heavy metal translocating P-type ATPase [Gemmiger gallinarum]MBE5038276.1 cadmium-translocating P-type ATPase [Gemmiger gallinarum]
MTKKQKKTLYRIIAAAVLLIVVALVTESIPMPQVLQFVLHLVPYLVIGWDILRKAFLGILHGEVFDENFLMAIATVGAMGVGEYREGVAVMLFYQVGELFQSYAVGKSRRSIAALMDIRPDSANLEQADGSLNTVDPEEVPVGAVIVVRPGERVPLDGAVLSGESSLNTSALTGESVPRTVRPGDEVISGCVNGDGLLRIEVRKPYGESTVAKILDLVENSSLKKARAENFITKFARYYTPAVCIAALALAVIPPLFVDGWMTWFTRALTFLVISCPCALVISIPLTFFGGIGGASRQGVLIKGGNYLEALAHTETAVFDKTGTLTRGIFAVERVRPAGDYAEAQVIELAAQAESYSNHPISKSLRAACAEQPDPKRTSDVQEIAGQGIRASVDGHAVAVGNARLMEALGIAYIPDDGVGTVVYVACDGAFLGSILIADEVKPTAAAAVSALKKQGVRTVMLTGDAPAVAEHVAAELGMDEVHAGLLPGDKVEQVEALLAAKRPGSSLAFVGDGINDAPVLMRADVGIAMGALGSDAAIEAADVVLMDDDPAKLSDAMRLARKCMRIVYENIIFALGIKIAFLILGAAGIATMWWAVFADVGVMVLAVLNAMRMLSTPKKH